MPTDNSLRTVASLDDITYIRTTQVKNFLTCPARWHSDMLGQGSSKISKAADIGTFIHSIIERYLLYQFELFTEEWDVIKLELEEAKIPAKERTSLLHLLQSLTEQRKHLINVEHTFHLDLIPDFYPIVGHIDAIFHNPELGDVHIIDWKTNRQYQGTEYWSNQYQPLLYSLAVATQFPNSHIIFEIRYVNLESSVIWEVTKEDIERYRVYLIQQYSLMRDEFKVYKNRDEWPERLNEYCGFCSRRDECQTLKNTHSEFMDSFLHTPEQSLPEKFIYIRNIKNIVEKQLDELKEKMIEEVQSNGGSLEDAGHVFRLSKSKKRTVELIPLWTFLYNSRSTLYGDEPVDLATALNNMSTVKITELDTFLLEYPKFNEGVSELVKVQESENFTLNILPKKDI